MLIRYTGEKPKKTLTLNSKVYEFAPTCDVADKEALKFLLSDEREGLFEEVKTENLPEHPSAPLPKPIKETGESKKRGRPKK